MLKRDPSSAAYLAAALAFLGIVVTLITILRPQDRKTFWILTVTFLILTLFSGYGALRRYYGAAGVSDVPVLDVKTICTETSAYIDITNVGGGATVWSILAVAGAVKRIPSAQLLGRWTHTSQPETWIAHGETCRITLAERRMDSMPLGGAIGFSSWVIFATEDGRPYTMESMYHSNPFARNELGQADPATAPDIEVKGHIFARPDAVGSLSEYRVILRAFRAVDMSPIQR